MLRPYAYSVVSFRAHPSDGNLGRRDPVVEHSARLGIRENCCSEYYAFHAGLHRTRTRGGGVLPWNQPSRKFRRARDKETGMLSLLIAAAALGGGFVATRNFVRRRLRFVDAVRKPAAPLVAGLAATIVALPVAALPLVTVWTAAAFGVGVAGGVASRRRTPGLPPPP